MLRLMIGDDLFFSGLRRFYLSSRFHKVGTEDFRLAMEQVSGLSLERFFERWIYGASLPQASFSYRVEAKDGGESAVLRVEQTGEVFDMPVLVTLTYADGTSRDVLLRVDDRVFEQTVPLTGRLRGAAVSKRDVTLADFK
jgi:aminopeptidase N